MLGAIIWVFVAILILFWLTSAIIGFAGDVIHFVLILAIALGIWGLFNDKNDNTLR